MPTKINKNNLLKFLIALIMFLTLVIPFISTQPPDTSSSKGVITAEFSDGKVKLTDITGKLTIVGTEGINTIELANGIIPNIESGNLVVENGNPVEGKLFFSDESSFDLSGQHITVPKDGSIEFKDGKIIVSKGTSVEVGGLDGIDGTKLTAKTDGTEIKIQGDIIEAKGRISVDYKENSPNKVILTGKDSVLELQTELKTGEKEKFEFKNSDDKELLVNIGSFHKSGDCTGKNCISYQEMGVGLSGEEWNKIKIDGNAIITKYFNEKKIYEINFEDGEAKISRDYLSKLKGITFSEKTVINYDNGAIAIYVETSEKRAGEIAKATGTDKKRIYAVYAVKGEDPKVVFDNPEEVNKNPSEIQNQPEEKGKAVLEEIDNTVKKGKIFQNCWAACAEIYQALGLGWQTVYVNLPEKDKRKVLITSPPDEQRDYLTSGDIVEYRLPGEEYGHNVIFMGWADKENCIAKVAQQSNSKSKMTTREQSLCGVYKPIIVWRPV